MPSLADKSACFCGQQPVIHLTILPRHTKVLMRSFFNHVYIKYPFLKPVSYAILFIISLCFLPLEQQAQMITGTWKGRIHKQKVELKIIQYGDSLTGTSYYYESASRYRRYSIKGYFDAATNEVVWWDDALIEVADDRSGKAGKMAMLSRADFNCPGDGRMMLDGKARGNPDGPSDADVHLDKTENSQFRDDWDPVIEGFLSGGNDPDLIRDVARAQQPDVQTETINNPAPLKPEPLPAQPAAPVVIREKQAIPVPLPLPVVQQAPTIEEKFVTRKKILVKEIPVSGDSLWLRFYDNAEIDGDSISLFLNNKLIFSHIRLTGNAYSIALPVNELGTSSELIMVAENLGSIPPNTSFMVAEVDGVRHEARLESTEGSSAMIRFVKKDP